MAIWQCSVLWLDRWSCDECELYWRLCWSAVLCFRTDLLVIKLCCLLCKLTILKFRVEGRRCWIAWLWRSSPCFLLIRSLLLLARSDRRHTSRPLCFASVELSGHKFKLINVSNLGTGKQTNRQTVLEGCSGPAAVWRWTYADGACCTLMQSKCQSIRCKVWARPALPSTRRGGFT